ncbi:unnamed protein product, partial [marine sediment metagenome]
MYSELKRIRYKTVILCNPRLNAHGYTSVDYPATHDSLDTVFGDLSIEMGRSDTLFFYTTNHGGGAGISVWNPMDAGGALTHTEVSDWLDSITCH